MSDKEKGDALFDVTVKRYEQEVGRKHHLDTKAGTQIGLSGVIIAIFGFVFGSLEFDDLVTNQHLWILGLGMGIILLSIGSGIFAVISKKNVPVFLPEKFYEKYKDAEEMEQRKQILFGYFDMIYDFEQVNNSQAKILFLTSILLIIGLVISFIALLLVFKVIGQ